MDHRGASLCVALLAGSILLPACGREQDPGTSFRTEIDKVQNLTIPDASYPANSHERRTGRYGAGVAWEFDTAMSSDAYIHWVSSRLVPQFTAHTNSQSAWFFSRYRDGDEETIRIETTPRSGRLHVLVTLDFYPD